MRHAVRREILVNLGDCGVIFVVRESWDPLRNSNVGLAGFGLFFLISFSSNTTILYTLSSKMSTVHFCNWMDSKSVKEKLEKLLNQLKVCGAEDTSVPLSRPTMGVHVGGLLQIK